MCEKIDLTAMSKEDLCEELKSYIREGPLGAMLAHPLVHEIRFLPGLANRQLEQKKRELEECVQDKDYLKYVFLHERPYRLEALLSLVDDSSLDMGSGEFAKIAREVWVDSENINQLLPQWKQVFRVTDGNNWMDAEERRAFSELPKVFTVYRGECDDGGISWTLREDVARFFANRGNINGATGIVTRGLIDKDATFAYLRARKRAEAPPCVFAYLTSRNEEEILVVDRRCVLNQVAIL